MNNLRRRRIAGAAFRRAGADCFLNANDKDLEALHDRQG
jgi:hypothetical protein